MSEQLLTRDQGLPIFAWRKVPGYPTNEIEWKFEIMYMEKAYSKPWAWTTYKVIGVPVPFIDHLTEPY